MRVEGAAAAVCSAVRLDNFQAIEGKGMLLMADDVTGEVQWKDTADSQKGIVMGPHAIRILPKGGYGR